MAIAQSSQPSISLPKGTAGILNGYQWCHLIDSISCPHDALRTNTSYLQWHSFSFVFLLSSFFLTTSSLAEKVVMLQTSLPIKCNRPGHSCVGGKAACDVSRLQDLLGQKDLFCSRICCVSCFSASLERNAQRGVARRLTTVMQTTAGCFSHCVLRV